MKTQRTLGDDTALIPRTLTKKALRIYFGYTPKRFSKYFITEDIRKLISLSDEENRYLREYDLRRTKVLINVLGLSKEDLVEIGRLQ